MIEIGTIYSSRVMFYDKKKQQNSFKYRPVLVIGKSDISDYTCLPISTISDRSKISTQYDYLITPSNFPNLNLKKTSYIRCHKQLPIHQADIGSKISILASLYEDTYLNVLSCVEEYNNNVMNNALDNMI